MPEEWIAVARASEIPQGGSRVVDVDGIPIALVRTRDDEVFAVMNVCPHRGGPVGEGEQEGRILTCPWHGWQFDLRTSAMTRNPAVTLRTFDVRVEDDVVRVRRETDAVARSS